MLRILLVSAMTLMSAAAFALTQPEIDGALASVSQRTKDAQDCLAIGGAKLDRRIVVKDLNGDGVEEILVVDTGETGAGICFGKNGHQMMLLSSDGKGQWKIALDETAMDVDFRQRADHPWPDAILTYADEATCKPVMRMGKNETYQAWKDCDTRPVEASTSSPETATSAGIGKLVPVEIYAGETNGPPYDHNGSLVVVDAEKGLILYHRPKKSISSTVKPLTVLFRGKPWEIGDRKAAIKGTAYAYKKGCPAAAYEVIGAYHSEYGLAQLTLQGAAPVRSKTSCDIVGHTTTGANSRLIFNIAVE